MALWCELSEDGEEVAEPQGTKWLFHKKLLTESKMIEARAGKEAFRQKLLGTGEAA